jgi:protoporphyrinogen oxidase
MSRTLVLGGGPAGLTAAWRLARRGHAVTVIEKLDRPGGLCLTVERDGFRFDLGGHRFISRNDELVEAVRQMMGEDLLERTRRSRILLDGKEFAYPLEASDLLHKLPKRTLAKAAAGYLHQAGRRALRDPDPRSFEDWTVGRFGRPLYDLFFGPYTEKLWGMPPSELSADWASQRISLMNLADVALRLTGLRGGGARTYARRYHYPRHGIGQLFEYMGADARQLGVDIQCDTTVTGIERADGRVTAVLADGPDGPTRFEADTVISTIPVQALAPMVDPSTQPTADGLRHRGLRFLNVALRGDHLLDGTWYYVSDPQYVMTRIQEPRQRSPEMAPPGHTAAMLEIPCDPGDPIWTMSDDDLAERVFGDMDALGRPIRDRALWWFSTRAAGAYPVYDLDYTQKRDRLLDTVDAIENLHTIGRQGLFRYIFMDTAMEMGWQAADDAIAGKTASSRRIMAIDQDASLREAHATTA